MNDELSILNFEIVIEVAPALGIVATSFLKGNEALKVPFKKIQRIARPVLARPRSKQGTPKLKINKRDYLLAALTFACQVALKLSKSTLTAGG